MTMLRLFALLFVALVASPAAAQLEARTFLDREMRLPGAKAQVHVEMRTVLVKGKEGDATASAGYLSYVVRSNDKARPVLFAFNGGPGASSAFVQIGVLGPWRSNLPSDPADEMPAIPALMPAAGGLLTKADLVFIDPPGTGYSQLPDGDNAAFAGVANDAAAVADLIDAWVTDHGRSDAPVYLLGESYGTIRAVALLDALESNGSAATVRGVILLGQALNMIETSQRPDNIVSHVVSLPTLAAIACYHGLVGEDCEVDRAIAESEAFGRDTYLAALFAGRDLEEEAHQGVAAKLEALTGIDAEWFAKNDLAISKEAFRERALVDRGLIMGRYDGRYTSKLPDDPSALPRTDPTSVVSDFLGEAFRLQLKEKFGLDDADGFIPVTRFEGDWGYGTGDTPFGDWPFMSIFERHAAADLCLRLFVGTGIFDLTTTIGAADYLFVRSSLSTERYENRRYVGGHMFYSDDASRIQLLTDLASFIDRETCR